MRTSAALLVVAALDILASPNSVVLAQAAGEAAAADEQVFTIDEYRVLGVTALPAVAVERAVYDYAGPGRTVADVEQARQSLERAYRDAGYGTVFVDIPE